MITNLCVDLRLKLYTRTRRFAFFDAGQALGYIVGLPLGTWLTNNHGLVAVFLTGSCTSLATMLYVALGVRESVTRRPGGHSEKIKLDKGRN